MFFDTHAHYDDEKFDEDREKVILRAYSQGVTNIINVGINLETSMESIRINQKYDFVYSAVGVHPHEVEGLNDNYINEIAKLALNEKVVAIGEIGLDYYYNNSPVDIQRKCFIQQINLAKELNLPVIIHDRDAHKDTMDIVKDEGVKKISGVVHCFSGSYEMAKEVLRNEMYIAIGGAITFKNSKRAVEVVKNIPIDRLLIETDLPYLTPEPFRGKRNESAYIRYVAEKIAEIRGTSIEEIADITTRNAKELFKIK